MAETLLLNSAVAVLTLPGDMVSACSAVMRQLEYCGRGGRDRRRYRSNAAAPLNPLVK